MHPAVTDWFQGVKDILPQYFINTRVLECGSCDVNGSVRSLWSYGCLYTGLDIAPGPGVDVVCPAHMFTSEVNFDTVISAEMLEHDPYWRESLKNMLALLRPGGLMIVTCAGPNRREHGTMRSCSPEQSPGNRSLGADWADYYCNVSINDVRSVIDFEKTFESYVSRELVQDGWGSDTQFWSVKKWD